MSETLLSPQHRVFVGLQQIGKEMVKGLLYEDFYRRDSIYITYRSLDTFVKAQLNFFEAGFAQETSGLQPLLQSSPLFPPAYVDYHIVEQARHDLDLLRRIVHGYKDNLTPSLTDRLKKSDALAYQALKRACDAGMIEPTTVLSYFQKSPSIRMIPYAPVALIGLPLSPLPLSSVDASENFRDSYRDLLVIPHEVGHQIYWRKLPDGSKNWRDQIDTVFQNSPTWIVNWLEEIFADVFSCLIAGPAVGVSQQERLLLLASDELVEDDSVHPVPLIRPYVIIEALRTMAEMLQAPYDEQYKNAADALALHWQAAMQSRLGDNLWFKIYGSNATITYDSAKHWIKTIVGKLFEGSVTSTSTGQLPLLRNLIPDPSALPNVLWSTGLADASPDSLNVLLAQVKDFDSKLNVTVPDLVEEDGQFYVQSVDPPSKRNFGETNLKFEEYRKAAIEHGPPICDGDTDDYYKEIWQWKNINVPWEDIHRRFPWWLIVLEAGGWISGPGGPGNLKDYQ